MGQGLLAFDAIERIMRDVNYGWLIRNIHAIGASMFFVAVYIHMLRGLYYGSYKAPRELLWMIGFANYPLMIVIAFLGYVLPWSQTSFLGATVIIKFVRLNPSCRDAHYHLAAGRFRGRRRSALRDLM